MHIQDSDPYKVGMEMRREVANSTLIEYMHVEWICQPQV